MSIYCDEGSYYPIGAWLCLWEQNKGCNRTGGTPKVCGSIPPVATKRHKNNE